VDMSVGPAVVDDIDAHADADRRSPIAAAR
jgi:hypothetical protein